MTDSLFALLQSCFPADRSTPVLQVPGGPACTYGELEAASGRFAAYMTALGLRPGDRVAMQVDKSSTALFAYLGCLRAGLVFLPMNTAYTDEEVDYLVGDAEPGLIICQPEREAGLRAVAGRHGVRRIATLDAAGAGDFADGAAGADPDFATVARAADDLAAILYTSGTTGRPKGAMLTQRNLASNGLVLRDAWGFTAGDVLLHALPIFHVHGLFIACHCALLSGARMIWLAKFDRAQVIENLPRATVMMGVPTFYTRLLDGDDFGAADGRSMRLFISGSAPLLPETHTAFRERTGHVILERYGMTEIGMHCSNPLDGERIAGTVGRPLAEAEIRVAGEDGALLGTDAVGELQVKGPNVFKGYWRMPEKTAEEFTADGWFKTGDMALVDAAGYVHLVGRAKDLIISGGYNIYPKEVERVIDAIDGVVESAAIGVPDRNFGESVGVVVHRAPGRDDLMADAVIAEAKRHLAGYKAPRHVAFVDALPRNTMGKVQKNVLREHYVKLWSAQEPPQE